MALDGIETDSFVAPAVLPTLPEAKLEYRGKLIRIEGASNAPDRLFICEKDASGKLVWRSL